MLVYGPVVDSTGSWGLAVFRANSLDDARALTEADRAVFSGIAASELGTMLVAIVPG